LQNPPSYTATSPITLANRNFDLRPLKADEYRKPRIRSHQKPTTNEMTFLQKFPDSICLKVKWWTAEIEKHHNDCSISIFLLKPYHTDQGHLPENFISLHTCSVPHIQNQVKLALLKAFSSPYVIIPTPTCVIEGRISVSLYLCIFVSLYPVTRIDCIAHLQSD
jgi:hypothetical protein